METVEGDTGFLSLIILLNSFSFGVIAELGIIAVLIFCSAMISGSESAFFSLRNKDLIDLQEDQAPFSSTIVQLLEHPRQLLATILIINTVVNISIAILASNVTSRLLAGSNDFAKFMVEVVTLTFVLVLLGEVTPKVYAAQYNKSFASFMAYPLFLLNKIFYPLSFFLTRTTSLLEKRIDKKGHDLLLDEIRHAIEITSDEESSQDEKKILKGIINFSSTYVKQIMTSRMDVVAHDITTPFPQLIAYINENRYSRIPIYRGSFDKIEGILYIKDLIPYLNEGNDFNWTILLREAYFVPDIKKIDDLLQEFQLKKVHLAIVVDEYGGTSGIVTMEDILEEIVGDINDEFDEDEIFYSRLDDENFVFNGKTSLNDVVKVMNLEDEIFDKVRGEAESIGGLVTELSGRIPLPGEQINFENFVFTVESSDRRRVKRVKISMVNAEEPGNGES